MDASPLRESRVTTGRFRIVPARSIARSTCSVPSREEFATLVAKRLLVPAFIAAVLVLGLADPAVAGRQWCKKDPAFLVAGTQVTVDVAVPWADQARVTGAFAVTMYVPKGTAASVLYVDDGFGGYGEAVSVLESNRLRRTAQGVQILVTVMVPATSKTIPVNVVVTPTSGRTASTNGRANATVQVNSLVVPTA
jgi:hypothetical protein